MNPCVRSWQRACILVFLALAAILAGAGCADEIDGPTPKVEPTADPPATCNFSNEENAAGSQVVTLRSPDGSFSPMAEDGLADAPGIALPRVFLLQGGGEIEVRRVEFVSTSELRLVIDASLHLAAGTYQFVVENPNGKRSEVSGALAVFDPPTVETIAPATVCDPNQVVTITGSGFREGTTVTVGGEPLAGMTIEDETTITGQVPADLAPGSYDVVVTSPEQCTATIVGGIEIGESTFTVASIVPAKGWTGIDNPVTVYGSGFVPGMTVALVGAAPDGGDWPLTFVNVDASGTFLTAVVPRGGEPGGPYPVRVGAPDGCAVDLAPGFRIDADPSIVLTAIIPPFGWTEAVTPVTITGTGFISTPKAYLVIADADPSVNPNRQLRSTAFVTDTSLSSRVPAGLPPGGPYDLVVINPDGGGGLLPAAFTVTSLPTPTIESVSPGAADTQADTPVTITGCNFREPLSVELRAPDGALAPAASVGAPDCTGAAACPGGTQGCTLAATLPTSTMTVGPYVVRLTNEDEGAWGEWSAFVVKNPSAKLDVWVAGTPMVTPRRGLAGASGRVDNPSRFLYAIGGNTGTAAPAYHDSVEIAPLDIFGGMGAWFEQRYRLSGPRGDATVVERGGYLYVIGGTSDGATPLGTVERAKILVDEGAPVIDDPPGIAAAGSLDAGTWYYRVSALRPVADPDNPGGETLPSDEVVVTLGVKGGVVLTWAEIPDAVGYRVYRTESVDGTSQSEVLLAELPAGTVTYTDDGAQAVDPTQTPLRRGSTGVWVTLPGGLAGPRFDHETVVAHDPAGDAFVYVIGGTGSCAGGPAAAALDCYEVASLSPDGATLGAWTSGGTVMVEPRTRFALTAAEPLNAPQVPAGQAYVYATGGAGVVESLEYAVVQAGGALGPFAILTPPQGSHPGVRESLEALIVSNAFYTIGGDEGALPLATIEFSVEFKSQVPPERSSFSSGSNSMIVPREDFALVLESTLLYAIGGSSDGVNAVSSVETVF
jgi:hypothetical protein